MKYYILLYKFDIVTTILSKMFYYNYINILIYYNENRKNFNVSCLNFIILVPIYFYL